MFIADTGDALNVEPGETILSALERNGYRPDSNCRAGICGACKLRLLEGEVDQPGEILSPTEKANGYVLSCIAHPLGQLTLASGGKPPSGVARRRVAGASGGRSGGKVLGLRVAAVVGISALLYGAWTLTNHQPDSWAAAASAAPTPAVQQMTPGSATPGESATVTLTATAGGGKNGGGGGAAPTATPSGSGGGQTNPPPQPTATPKPKPAPTATSTPSPKR
jgi:ferredoxin